MKLRKIIAFVLVCVFVITLVACGDNDTKKDENKFTESVTEIVNEQDSSDSNSYQQNDESQNGDSDITDVEDSTKNDFSDYNYKVLVDDNVCKIESAGVVEVEQYVGYDADIGKTITKTVPAYLISIENVSGKNLKFHTGHIDNDKFELSYGHLGDEELSTACFVDTADKPPYGFTIIYPEVGSGEKRYFLLQIYLVRPEPEYFYQPEDASYLKNKELTFYFKPYDDGATDFNEYTIKLTD
ncbi:MAG: hypothetical protein IJ224_07295 [Lachnospiraceae bacterium]|nr:hypothetical protein [Lachnospiraceae bacterium]